MSERFQRLYELPRNLYSPDSSVIVEAGALLKDTETGKLVVQLKFQSVALVPIKALKVSLSTFDYAGIETHDAVEYRYLDLNIGNGASFGSNKAISISNETVRSFTIKGITVTNFDNTSLSSDLPLTQLPTAKTLQSAFENAELVKQYQIEVNNVATFVPQESNALWQCACGKWNSDSVCTSCWASKKWVFENTNVEKLSVSVAERQEAARLRELEETKLKAERKAKIAALFNRVKKIAIIATTIACVLGIAIAVILKATELKLEDAISWTSIEEAEMSLGKPAESTMYKARMLDKKLAVRLDEKEDFLGAANFYYYFHRHGKNTTATTHDTTPTEKEVTSAEKYLNKVLNSFSKELGEPQTKRGYLGYIVYEWEKEIVRIELIDNTTAKICNEAAVFITITYRDQDLCKHPETTHSHKEATCTEDGYDSTVCTVCYYEKLVTKAALGHDYTSEITRAPTTENAGEETLTCSVCSFVETRPIEMLPRENNTSTASVNLTLDKLQGVWLMKRGQLNDYYSKISISGTSFRRDYQIMTTPELSTTLVEEGTIISVGENSFTVELTYALTQQSDGSSWHPNIEEPDRYPVSKITDSVLTIGVHPYYKQ